MVRKLNLRIWLLLAICLLIYHLSFASFCLATSSRGTTSLVVHLHTSLFITHPVVLARLGVLHQDSDDCKMLTEPYAVGIGLDELNSGARLLSRKIFPTTLMFAIGQPSFLFVGSYNRHHVGCPCMKVYFTAFMNLETVRVTVSIFALQSFLILFQYGPCEHLLQ